MNTENSHNNKVIIIPTLSNKSGLESILQCISQFNKDTPVIIINNDPKQSINEKKNQTVIQNGKNEGFAKACNRGAAKAKELYDPEYFIFLNDDVRFESDWINASIKSMKSKDWSATSPVLNKSDGTIENAGYVVLPYGKVQLIKDPHFIKEVDGISAAALIIESESFFNIGGFDERFFAYLEDVDLCLRLKKKGYSLGITNAASVIHTGQVTSSKFRTYKAYLDFRNWILLIVKNWGWQKILKNLPGIIIERLRNFWGIIKTFI